ncbi:MAG: ankyrin repeat domain-containing protein [Rhizobiales bacterium]|nr:ankyrin repeat domain-containing protein [Hyphomicrobiales bacterium]
MIGAIVDPAMTHPRATSLVLALLLASVLRTGPASASDLADAILAGNSSGVSALIEAGALPDQNTARGLPLHLAIEKGDVAVTAALLRGGANVETAGEPAGAHALHLSALRNDVAISILLIKHGARTEARDAKGRTPVMVAAEAGSTRALSVLLDNGANVDSFNPATGETALGYAVAANRIECAKLLIEEGADPNLPNKGSGQTPIFHAARLGFVDMVELLVDSGADLNIRDAHGRSVRQATTDQEMTAILQELGFAE